MQSFYEFDIHVKVDIDFFKINVSLVEQSSTYF